MHQVSVGYPTMHKAPVFLYVYNSTLWEGLQSTIVYIEEKESLVHVGVANSC